MQLYASVCVKVRVTQHHTALVQECYLRSHDPVLATRTVCPAADMAVEDDGVQESTDMAVDDDNVQESTDMAVEDDGVQESAPSTEEPMMRVECIPKANSSFALTWGANLVVVDGQRLQQRNV